MASVVVAAAAIVAVVSLSVLERSSLVPLAQIRPADQRRRPI